MARGVHALSTTHRTARLSTQGPFFSVPAEPEEDFHHSHASSESTAGLLLAPRGSRLPATQETAILMGD